MNILDSILGRKNELPQEALPNGVTRADALAVDRYQQMLRTASAKTIERVNVEAFEKLTPAQLDLLFERFTSEASTMADRPSDARPKSLARSARRVEARQPGAIGRVLATDADESRTRGWMGGSLLDTIANYAIASSIWDAWEYSLLADSSGWADFGDWF